jgi:hypothetical protein
MTFPSVIERELRMRSRQGTMYWGRCGAGAIACLFAVYYAGSSAGTMGPASMGTAMFAFLSWLGLLAACAFYAVTADCISLERREGTLGLLFLTGLRTMEVVGGKLLAAGLTGFFALIAGVPALALAVLSGGVTGGQVIRTALSLLAILFVSLASGLVASARSESQSEAWRKGGLLLLAVLAGPWIAAIALRPLAALSPLSSFFEAADLSYRAAPLKYWCGLGLSVAEATLLLVTAAFWLRRNWGQLESRGPAPRHPWFISKSIGPKAPPLSDRHSGLLEKDPICWLSLRLHDQSRLIWVGALLMILSRPATTVLFRVGIGRLGGIASGIMLFSSFFAAIMFAWAAGKFFYDARQNGELELLLSTPLGGRDIVSGRWNALLIRLRGPLLLVGFMMFLEFIFMGGAGVLLFPGGSRFIFQQVMGPINMILTAVAVFWVGMWFGLRASRPIGVIAWPVGLVIGLPWLAYYVIAIVISVGSPFGRIGPAIWWPIGWPLFTLAKNVFFIRWAAGKLKNEFRTVAPLAVGDWFKEPQEMATGPDAPIRRARVDKASDFPQPT